MTEERPVRTRDILDIQDEVTLEIGTVEGTDWIRGHVSRVLEDGMVVAVPKDAIDLASNQEWRGARITRESKGAVFTARALRVTRENDPPLLLTLKLESQWQRIQRRKDVRLRIMLNTRLERSTESDEPEIIDATMLDVSAGGILVQSKRPLDRYERVTALFKLPGEETPLETDAEVVRVMPVQDGKWGVFRIGLRFMRLLESERTKIVRFIFQEQAKVRRLDADREWDRKG